MFGGRAGAAGLWLLGAVCLILGLRSPDGLVLEIFGVILVLSGFAVSARPRGEQEDRVWSTSAGRDRERHG